jgi:hypothetical protein
LEISFLLDIFCFLRVFSKLDNYFSSETVSFFLPLALLVFNTFLPPADSFLALNPCEFFLLRFDG